MNTFEKDEWAIPRNLGLSSAPAPLFSLPDPSVDRLLDSASVARFLQLLRSSSPTAVFELRILGKGTTSGYFNDVGRAVTALELHLRKRGLEQVYVTLNPVLDCLLARADNRLREYARNTTGDAEIASLRWMPVDCDPVRPAGISATDAEMAAAIETRDRIADALDRCGVKCIKGFSGNGGHLLILLAPTAPAPEFIELRRLFLESLAKSFDTKWVCVDTGVFNAARIWKLYGTYACKGDPRPDRPYRMAKLDFPSSIPEPVDFQSLVARFVRPEATAAILCGAGRKLIGRRALRAPFDMEAYLRTLGLDFRVVRKAEGTWFNFRDCPVHTDHDGHHFECGVIVGVDGRLGGKCQHEPGKSWHDFKRALGDTRPRGGIQGLL